MDTTPRRHELAKRLLIPAFLAIPMCWFTVTRLDGVGVDWREVFYPAVRLALSGQNPYQIAKFYNPPWVLLLLIPFALLGEGGGLIALYVCSVFAYAYVSWRLRAKPIAMAVFLLSPLVVDALKLGNIDALVLLGFVLPAPVGLLFAVLKPQISIAAVAYWAFAAWKDGGIRAAVTTFVPVILSTAISFVVFGNWLAGRSNSLQTGNWNTSLLPWSAPAGLYLLYLAIRHGKFRYSIAASPFISPYVGISTWAVALLGFVESEVPTVAAVMVLWAIFIVERVL